MSNFAAIERIALPIAARNKPTPTPYSPLHRRATHLPHPLITTLSPLLSATLLPAQAQTPLALADIHCQPELEQTIRSLDTALFAAYNSCNLPAFSALVADDVEFYHDGGGLTLGRAASPTPSAGTSAALIDNQPPANSSPARSGSTP